MSKAKAGPKGNPNWRKGGPSPNPTGKAKATAPPDILRQDPRFDGWTNLLLGIGSAARDKRLTASFVADVLSDEQALELWRGDDLAARAVEVWPNEMLREGWELCTDDEDKDRTEAITKYAEDLGFDSALQTAMQYENAYGGGAILMGIQDGRTPDQPVNPKSVRSIDFLTVLEPRELQPLHYYTNPLAPKFGEVEVWQVVPVINGTASSGQFTPTTMLRIHESRLIIFGGIRVTRMQVGTRAGWGDSLLGRVYRILRDFNAALDAAGVLVTDFSQAVWKITGLADLVLNDNSDAVTTRLQAMDMARSILRAVVIDKDEDFERKTTNVTGLPDLIDRFATRLAAAVDMPLTLLMGQSPGGLNATGASDIRFFYDRVASKQQKKLLPVIKRFLRLVMAAVKYEPAVWSVDFNPLWQQTEKEIADARQVQATTDKTYIEAQVLTPEEVKRSRFAGDKFSFETQVDTDDAEIDTIDPEALAAAASLRTPAAATPTPTPTPSAPAPVAEVAKTAMTGVQVTSLIDVIKATANGEIDRQSGVEILMLAFQVDKEQAEKLLGSATFKPTPPPAPPGGGFGGKSAFGAPATPPPPPSGKPVKIPTARVVKTKGKKPATPAAP
jgi:phage-related protein (TIGR01555 family)